MMIELSCLAAHRVTVSEKGTENCRPVSEPLLKLPHEVRILLEDSPLGCFSGLPGAPCISLTWFMFAG